MPQTCAARFSKNRKQLNSSAWKDALIIIRSIREHATLLAGVIFFLSGIAVFHYIMQEKVPLNILSPSMISALPMIFIAIVIVTLTVAAAPFIPLIALVEDEILFGKSTEINGKRLFYIMLRQAFGLIGPGLSIAYIVTILVYADQDITGYHLLGTFLVGYLTIVLATLINRRHYDIIGKDSAWISSLAPAMMQTVVITIALAITLNFTYKKTQSENIAIITTSVVCTLLPVLQIVIATALARTRSRFGTIKTMFWGSVATVILAILFPYSGANLADLVLSASASGANRCVQLKLPSDAVVDHTLLSAPNPVMGETPKLLTAQHGQKTDLSDDSRNRGINNSIFTTTPLRLLALSDGYYLARIAQQADNSSSTIYRVPESMVLSITPCPKEKKDDAQQK